MKQNIFDDPAMFDAYMKFRREDVGFNVALEIPAMLSLLPNVNGKSVCDIGCGAGKLSRHIAANGAKAVVAVDPSARMLALAKAEGESFVGIVEYHCEFIEEFCPEPCSFDLVVSSLALHYVADIQSLFSRVRTWIRPGGAFLFSVEHPIFSAGPREWVRGADGFEYWPVTDYFGEGAKSIYWLTSDVVKYHRTMSTWTNALINSGFDIARVVEPQFAGADATNCNGYQNENARPFFLILSATVASRQSASEGGGSAVVHSR